MSPSSFPSDDYTPYGYLDNPYQAGPWVGFEAGGVIRSVEACGFAWFWPRGEERAEAALQVGVSKDSRRLMTVDEFRAAGIGLVSRYHSGQVQTFDFTLQGAQVSLAYALAGRDALLCQASFQQLSTPVKLIIRGAVTLRKGRNARVQYMAEADAVVLLADPGPWYAVCASQPSSDHRFSDDGIEASAAELVVGAATSIQDGALAAELELWLESDSGGEAKVWIALGRGADRAAALGQADTALQRATEVLQARFAADDRFWKRTPRPVGDWPEAWRRGWVYDLETTRLMVRPPAGDLKGAWPTWHLLWPRVVLAENSLDMMRLAYADPDAAQAALLTLFRDAPRPNIPCMYANGSFNMVAEGGDACGTSPAWCLPLHNIYLLYLWRPDRDWLGALYPHLEAYLHWWLDHRRDAEGWFVYRCTWESGEDSTPRLDPEQTGHGDIFGSVRPVELQAAMAQSAWILVRLGRELGLKEAQLSEWMGLHQEYTERTRSLWDSAAGRFRDGYPPGSPPMEARPAYWGAPADASPLQLLPLMYGVASAEQAEALSVHLMEFNRTPWRLWASWTYTIVEAARAVGAYGVAGRLACEVLSAVYPRLDRRDLADVGARPGTSCEWWPDDLSQTTVLNETYGWGATTATLLLRHVFGFGPAADTHEVVFELAPSLQGDLLTTGGQLGFANLHYRGVVFDMQLTVSSANELTVRLKLGFPGRVSVNGEEGPVPVHPAGGSVKFQIRNAHRYSVTVARHE